MSLPELEDIVGTLNASVEKGLLHSYRIEGNTLFIKPVQPIEHITIKASITKNISEVSSKSQ